MICDIEITELYSAYIDDLLSGVNCILELAFSFELLICLLMPLNHFNLKVNKALKSQYGI